MVSGDFPADGKEAMKFEATEKSGNQISTAIPDSLWNTKASFITEISLRYTHLLKPKDIFIKTTVYKDKSSAIAV